MSLWHQIIPLPSLSSLESRTSTNRSVQIHGAWEHLDACVLPQSVIFMRNKTLTERRLKQLLWQGFEEKKNNKKKRGRWHAAVLAVIFLCASCNFKRFSGMHFSHVAHFSEDYHMQMSTSPNCASDQNIKQNQLSETRRAKHPVSVFFFFPV